MKFLQASVPFIFLGLNLVASSSFACNILDVNTDKVGSLVGGTVLDANGATVGSLSGGSQILSSSGALLATVSGTRILEPNQRVAGTTSPTAVGISIYDSNGFLVGSAPGCTSAQAGAGGFLLLLQDQ